MNEEKVNKKDYDYMKTYFNHPTQDYFKCFNLRSHPTFKEPII